MRETSIMIYKISLTLKIKYGHMVSISRCRRLHNNVSKIPLSTHNIICGCIGHLLSPVYCKEQVILSIIISLQILLSVQIRRLSICMIHSVKNTKHNIIALAISYRKFIRITVLILYGNHILI